MAYAPPGSVAVNSTVPFGAQGLDQATWIAGAADILLQGIVDQARKNGGDASKVGMPASWPYGPLPTNSVHADGSLNPILVAQVQQYVNSPNAQQDQDFNRFVGVNFSTASPGGYMDKPLTPSEQLARDQFDYNSSLNALKLATGGGTSSGVKVSASTQRPPSTGGGGGGSSTDYEARLAYEASSNNLDYQLAKQKQDLQLALMQKQFDLDNDPNNPKLKLERDKLAQEMAMFQQSLAQKTQSEQEALNLQRGKTIADYAANPGDAVAREYFLRQQGAQPLGTPVDIFTGQQGEGQMTLSDLMKRQAPLLKPYLGAQVTGAPVPTTPPPTEPPPPAPEEPVPAFAHGTGEITKDGWTRADKFVTGDHPMGMPNPEINQVRVRNGRAETKVTPLSQMMGNMPMFARGTGSNISTNSNLGGAENPFAGMDLSGSTQEQSMAYQPSTATSPTYNSTGQSNISFGDPKNPYAGPGSTMFSDMASKSGNPVNASMAAADPYFGSQYQGMAPDAMVTNANSQYYGMTAADAFQAQLRQNAQTNPKALDELGQVINNQYAPMTVVGPIGGYTTGGWLGAGENSAQVASDFAYGDSAYTANQYMRPINQVNNQADAGILTGAQRSAGVTQSANPAAPNYVPPAGWPTAPTDPNNPAAGAGVTGNVVTAPDQTKMAAGYSYTQDAQGNWHEVPPPGSKVAPDAGNLENDQIQNGQPVNSGEVSPTGVGQVYSHPNSTVQTRQVNDQGYEEVIAPGKVEFNGATFDIRAGDYRSPDGGWLRWNPVLKDYSPLLPTKVTQINNEADFWRLPAAEQQKILTGQQTGYALNGDWKGGLLAGLGQPGVGEQASGIMRPEQFAALSDAEKRNLIDNPPIVQGSNLPDQTFDRYDNGPMRGQLSSLISLKNPEGAMSSGQPFDYASYMVGPNEAIYNREAGVFGPRNAPVEFNRLMYPWAQPRPRTTADPTPGMGTPPPPTTGTTPPPPPATGTPPPPATGTGTPPPPTGTTGTPPATGAPPATGTPPATGGNNQLSDIINAIMALSYGGDVYQNLPALRLLAGDLSQGEYDTIGNAPVEVPGLPVSLPSANQTANYNNLQYLQQSNPEAFALLNSLYTAGNVPLSAIMAMAKSRAPLGSAYETSLVDVS